MVQAGIPFFQRQQAAENRAFRGILSARRAPWAQVHSNASIGKTDLPSDSGRA